MIRELLPDGADGTGCAAEQQEAQLCTWNFHGMLASRRKSALRLLVPPAHSHSVEVPTALSLRTTETCQPDVVAGLKESGLSVLKVRSPE